MNFDVISLSHLLGVWVSSGNAGEQRQPWGCSGVQTVCTSISAFLSCSDKGNYYFILCETVFWDFFCPNLFICWLLLRLGIKLCPMVWSGQVTHKVRLSAWKVYIAGVFWGLACRNQRGSRFSTRCFVYLSSHVEAGDSPLSVLWLISRAHPVPTQKPGEEGGHRVQMSSLSLRVYHSSLALWWWMLWKG